MERDQTANATDGDATRLKEVSNNAEGAVAKRSGGDEIEVRASSASETPPPLPSAQHYAYTDYVRLMAAQPTAHAPPKPAPDITSRGPNTPSLYGAQPSPTPFSTLPTAGPHVRDGVPAATQQQQQQQQKQKVAVGTNSSCPTDSNSGLHCTPSAANKGSDELPAFAPHATPPSALPSAPPPPPRDAKGPNSASGPNPAGGGVPTHNGDAHHRQTHSSLLRPSDGGTSPHYPSLSSAFPPAAGSQHRLPSSLSNGDHGGAISTASPMLFPAAQHYAPRRAHRGGGEVGGAYGGGGGLVPFVAVAAGEAVARPTTRPPEGAAMGTACVGVHHEHYPQSAKGPKDTNYSPAAGAEFGAAAERTFRPLGGGGHFGTGGSASDGTDLSIPQHRSSAGDTLRSTLDRAQTASSGGTDRSRARASRPSPSCMVGSRPSSHAAHDNTVHPRVMDAAAEVTGAATFAVVGQHSFESVGRSGEKGAAVPYSSPPLLLGGAEGDCSPYATCSRGGYTTWDTLQPFEGDDSYTYDESEGDGGGGLHQHGGEDCLGGLTANEGPNDDAHPEAAAEPVAFLRANHRDPSSGGDVMVDTASEAAPRQQHQQQQHMYMQMSRQMRSSVYSYYTATGVVAGGVGAVPSSAAFASGAAVMRSTMAAGGGGWQRSQRLFLSAEPSVAASEMPSSAFSFYDCCPPKEDGRGDENGRDAAHNEAYDPEEEHCTPLGTASDADTRLPPTDATMACAFNGGEEQAYANRTTLGITVTGCTPRTLVPVPTAAPSETLGTQPSALGCAHHVGTEADPSARGGGVDLHCGSEAPPPQAHPQGATGSVPMSDNSLPPLFAEGNCTPLAMSPPPSHPPHICGQPCGGKAPSSVPTNSNSSNAPNGHSDSRSQQGVAIAPSPPAAGGHIDDALSPQTPPHQNCPTNRIQKTDSSPSHSPSALARGAVVGAPYYALRSPVSNGEVGQAARQFPPHAGGESTAASASSAGRFASRSQTTDVTPFSAESSAFVGAPQAAATSFSCSHLPLPFPSRQQQQELWHDRNPRRRSDENPNAVPESSLLGSTCIADGPLVSSQPSLEAFSSLRAASAAVGDAFMPPREVFCASVPAPLPPSFAGNNSKSPIRRTGGAYSLPSSSQRVPSLFAVPQKSEGRTDVPLSSVSSALSLGALVLPPPPGRNAPRTAAHDNGTEGNIGSHGSPFRRRSEYGEDGVWCDNNASPAENTTYSYALNNANAPAPEASSHDNREGHEQQLVQHQQQLRGALKRPSISTSLNACISVGSSVTSFSGDGRRVKIDGAEITNEMSVDASPRAEACVPEPQQPRQSALMPRQCLPSAIVPTRRADAPEAFVTHVVPMFAAGDGRLRGGGKLASSTPRRAEAEGPTADSSDGNDPLGDGAAHHRQVPPSLISHHACGADDKHEVDVGEDYGEEDDYSDCPLPTGRGGNTGARRAGGRGTAAYPRAAVGEDGVETIFNFYRVERCHSGSSATSSTTTSSATDFTTPFRDAFD